MKRVGAGHEFVRWAVVGVVLGAAIGWLFNFGWRGGVLIAVPTGVMLWLVRFLEGNSLAEMPWDKEIEDLEKRVRRLEGRPDPGSVTQQPDPRCDPPK